jgi:predicted DNA-binding protein with PD1-like motif
MKTHVFRLKRGDDLRASIDVYALEKGIKAGVILTCVGNLEKAVLRMADETITKTYEGTLEIVSLVGTLEAGNSHLHISISDVGGAVWGGHLKKGTLVGVTSEIVLGELEDTIFTRQLDPETGFEELVVTE